MEFNKIAIVNRGEPAMRLINAVAEYNREHGTDLSTVALFTEPDRRAMFVREADEAYSLGPAHVTDADGNRRVTYVDYDVLEQALIETGADTVWVGWGFVSEQADFAALCERNGIVFIGPSVDVMRRLGDKITSKQIAEAAEVPVAAWSREPVETVEEALRHAKELGYPLMVKATAGGGGRGIRKVTSAAELVTAFPAAKAEAASAFGNDTVFIETLVTGARHIEVQIIGDSAGTVWAVGVRDCSVQRRNQKVIEEAPSPALSPEQDEFIRAAAVRLGKAAGYRNAGTVEFLFDESSGEFFFMEVDTRLQVEHTITELTTGIDLVKLQLDMARGLKLEGPPPATVGHAIEARLNAEDPDAGFAPAPGLIEMMRLPVGPGLRVDTGVEEGDEIAPEYDSMIAKVMAYGRTREEARSRLGRALSQMRVLIHNGASNKAFLEALLSNPEFVAADVDIGWLDRITGTATVHDQKVAAIALVAASIGAYEERNALEMRLFRASAARGRPEVSAEVAHAAELRYAGERYSLSVGRLSPTAWRIAVDGITIEVEVEDLGRVGLRLRCNDTTYRILSAAHGASHYVEVDGVAHRIAYDEGGIVRAPSPAVVVSLPVNPGEEVAAGDRIAVIEAMKMETSLTAEFSGVVRELLVRENVQVGPGTALLVIDPHDKSTEEHGTRLNFSALGVVESGKHRRCIHYLTELRSLLLGWDITPERLDELIKPDGPLCDNPANEAELRELEDEVLGIFVDVVALFRRHPIDRDIDGSRRGSEEYLFNYLRDLDAKGEGLPDGFIDRIHRSVGHYGIDSLEPTKELQAALLRIAKAYARMQDQTRPILRVLEDRLEHGSLRSEPAFRELLERLIAQTRGRYQAVHDMAREVHYQAYDVPFLERVRRAAYADVERDLRAMFENPDGPDRAERISGLVDCTQPLLPILIRRLAGAAPNVRAALMEVMNRRYYRIRSLEDVACGEIDGFGYSTGRYAHDDTFVRVISIHAEYSAMAEAAAAVNRIIDDYPADKEFVADLYVWHPEGSNDPNVLHDDINAVLDEQLGERQLRRVVVGISGPTAGFGPASVHNMTFRPAGDNHYNEQGLYRDLHPMMAKRLELWRLEEFFITRLPTPQDVYLFHAVARTNPRDERLFAFAEVRDMTPLRDEGRTVRIPEFERIYREALAPIRRFQARRAVNRRLWWNRVVLAIWPVLDLEDFDIGGIVERLAPDTEGLGLETVAVRLQAHAPDGTIHERLLEINNPSGTEVQYRLRRARHETITTLSKRDQDVVRLRRRGLMHPFEVVSLLAPRHESRQGFPQGTFQEYDLNADGALEPVDREIGDNSANVVVGVVSNVTNRYPEGITRVAILSDPTLGMGNLSEPECARIVAALDHAEEIGVPLEWFAVSAGALISMESGTENMDWIGAVLRRIIEFTQSGHELNIIVGGINVGAQPYWNAEATMLMHTKGILIMTPTAAMVLTGKEALDYSGGVSAEDNEGIGGYERIMGPNGQAQYFANDAAEACRILLQHYEYSYVVPGERFPRPATTDDPVDRDVSISPHGGSFATVGEVFSEATNPGRKRPFEMRAIMEAVADADLPTLERWYGMQDAETSIVWDAYLGGIPVTLIGFESKPMPRLGAIPADGPGQWTSGTLFPRSSKKTARAINAASNSRPVVVLANLSGFDGSPESMRSWQLEYGAEIGRAVVNFEGPIVFCVVSRYHGGAFVVFSQTLHDNMVVAAVEGSVASVIGGAPAAAVVFARDVRRRTETDSRVADLAQRAAETTGGEKARLLDELERVRAEVHSEKLGEVADEFDTTHNIQRARAVGSVNEIVPPEQLRSFLIGAVQQGIATELERLGKTT